MQLTNLLFCVAALVVLVAGFEESSMTEKEKKSY